MMPSVTVLLATAAMILIWNTAAVNAVPAYYAHQKGGRGVLR